MSAATVGFVGLGTMGAPMAACAARVGFALVVHDVDRAALDRVASDTGARVANSASEVAGAADMVVAMLPTGADVREAALDENGLADGFGGNGVLIDMSSSGPVGTVALAAELAARGIAMIDAPVSGGRAKAVDGTLTIMAGGDGAAVDRCLPVLEAVGERIFRTGAIGSGHAAKALNNLLNAAGQLAAAEALSIGARFGLDPDTLLDVINVSSGMNQATMYKVRQFVLSRAFDSDFAMDLMLKDVTIALDLARETGTPAPFSERCRALWSEARDALGPGRDQTEIARWVETRAGTELRSKG